MYPLRIYLINVIRSILTFWTSIVNSSSRVCVDVEIFNLFEFGIADHIVSKGVQIMIESVLKSEGIEKSRIFTE